MRFLHQSVFVIVLAALVTAPAPAQLGGRPDRGGGGLVERPSGGTLVLNKSVQEELKLTADQVKDVSAAVRKVREKYQDDLAKLRTLEPKDQAELLAKVDKETLKAVGDVLKPEQAKRLKQIEFQEQWRQIPQAFLQGDVAKELQLTGKQKERIATILDQLNQDLGAALLTRELEEIPKLRKKA